MKNKFLSASIGITMMLFGAGFFVRSFSVANATPTPESFLQAGTNTIGKYRIEMVYDSWKYDVFVVIWNTETGKTAFYKSNGSKVEKIASLPENPLDN
jgi:hypothetical protein